MARLGPGDNVRALRGPSEDGLRAGPGGALLRDRPSLPLALGYLLLHGEAGRVFTGPLGKGALVAASGAVTSIPLAAFAFAVRRLRLATVGLLQYIAPSLSFLLGIFVYREPFSRAQIVTFLLIWVGVAAYSAESVWAARRAEGDAS